MAVVLKRYSYDYDPTGENPENLIRDERHTITAQNRTPQNIIIPGFAPFHRKSLVVRDLATGQKLLENIDFTVEYPIFVGGKNFKNASPIYGAIQFLDKAITGQFEITYQTVGGQFALDGVAVAKDLANKANDPLTTSFEEIIGKPLNFPPLEHVHSVRDFLGWNDVVNSVNGIADALRSLREDQSAPGYQTLAEYYLQLSEAYRTLINDLATTKSDVTNRFEEFKNELQNKFEETRATLEENFRNSNAELLERIQNFETAIINRLNENIGALRGNVQTNTNNINALQQELPAKVNEAKEQLNAEIRRVEQSLTTGMNNTHTEIRAEINSAVNGVNANLEAVRQRVTTLEALPAVRLRLMNGKLIYDGSRLLTETDKEELRQLASTANGADWNTNLTNIPNTLHYSTNPYVQVTASDASGAGWSGVQINSVQDRFYRMEMDPNTGALSFKLRQGDPLTETNNLNRIEIPNNANGAYFVHTSGNISIGHGRWIDQKTSGATYMVSFKNTLEALPLDRTHSQFYPLVKLRLAGSKTTTSSIGYLTAINDDTEFKDDAFAFHYIDSSQANGNNEVTQNNRVFLIRTRGELDSYNAQWKIFRDERPSNVNERGLSLTNKQNGGNRFIRIADNGAIYTHHGLFVRDNGQYVSLRHPTALAASSPITYEGLEFSWNKANVTWRMAFEASSDNNFKFHSSKADESYNILVPKKNGTVLLDVDVSELRAEVANLRNELNAEKAKLTAANTTINELRTSLNAEKSKVATLQNNYTTINNAVTTLRNELNTAKSNIAAVTTKANTLQSEVTTLKSKVAALEARPTSNVPPSLTSDVATIKQKLNAIGANVADFANLKEAVRQNTEFRNSITFEY